ncbi:dynamin family protein [Rutstroemia sp. NJR-2017a BVV2]|nr:dynamin family protein [Rutstroemia sp. NJR-2017a BVV2]
MPPARGRQIMEEEAEVHDLVSPSPYNSKSPAISRVSVARTMYRAASVPRHSQNSRATLSTTHIEAIDIDVIGKHSKVFITAIDELRQYDIEHVVKLPKIIVVGDQSAGKSSIMSALTGTHIPRKNGTCTRCPANIVTSAAETWSCTISLWQKYEYVQPRQPVKPQNITQKNPFYPWRERDLRNLPFKVLTDKSELEDAMKWAQIALLNHNQNYKSFIPGAGQRWEEDDVTTEAEFSPNVVVVSISGPDLTSLSFFDLPGIIVNSAKSEQDYLIHVFENLAVKHIEEQNSLIIFTMTMSVDAVMSKTKKVIVDNNATARCVGVLTKPDTFSDKKGDVSDWEKVLLGTEHIMGHGYFATKQPGPNFRYDSTAGSYHDQARKEEAEFFDKDELWSGRWKHFRSRCGTAVIQEFLSCQLAKEIAKSIKERITLRMLEIDGELKMLPALPQSDIQHVILKILLRFSSKVQSLMNGELASSDHSFYSQWKTLSDDFYRVVINNQPEIELSDPSDVLKPAVIELSDDEDDKTTTAGVPGTPSGKHPNKRPRPQDAELPQTPRKRGKAVVPSSSTPVKDENSFSEMLLSTPSRRPHPGPNSLKGSPFAHHTNNGKKFISVREIATKIHRYAQPGMPGIINHRVYDEFCKDAVRQWLGPLQTLLSETVRLLKKELNNLLDEHLGIYYQTPLFHVCRKLLDQYVDRYYTYEIRATNELYNLEVLRMFTVDNPTLTDNKRKELERIQKMRRNIRAYRKVDQMLSENPKKFANLEPAARERAKQKMADEVSAESLGRDQFEATLPVASYIRAYYITAAHRFTDSVCLGIHNRLFHAVSENIDSYLEKELGINRSTIDAQAKCEALMADNTGMAAKRRKLINEKSQLESCAKRLDKLCADIKDLGSQNENDGLDVAGMYHQYNPVDEMMQDDQYYEQPPYDPNNRSEVWN